jgi:hypothetical protein
MGLLESIAEQAATHRSVERAYDQKEKRSVEHELQTFNVILGSTCVLLSRRYFCASAELHGEGCLKLRVVAPTIDWRQDLTILSTSGDVVYLGQLAASIVRLFVHWAPE